MSETVSISISTKRDTDLIGEHNIRKVTFHVEGLCSIEQFSDGVTDFFTQKPLMYSFECGREAFAKLSYYFHEPDDDVSGTYVAEIAYSDGTSESVHIRADGEAIHYIQTVFTGILTFEETSSEHVRTSLFTSEMLDRLLDSGKISREVYQSKIGSIRDAESRKRTVSDAIDDASYPFTVSSMELKADRESGLLTDDQYNMFVWFFRLREGCGDTDNSSDFISLKLRFSVWGQRLLGKYDTYEFLLVREDSEVVDRRYSVHGTLFEGCGNYKAPDDAEHIELDPERTHKVFRYLGMLNEKGILGRDHSEAKYDCAFFDLYTRFEDSPSLHTKGTSEYPYFIKFLMYLMKQDLASIY